MEAQKLEKVNGNSLDAISAHLGVEFDPSDKSLFEEYKRRDVGCKIISFIRKWRGTIGEQGVMFGEAFSDSETIMSRANYLNSTSPNRVYGAYDEKGNYIGGLESLR